MWSYYDESAKAKVVGNTPVRRGPGHRVHSFLELATKIAELQFRNPNHVLLYRGQRDDYLNAKLNTSLKPQLLRGQGAYNPDEDTLVKRFRILDKAEGLLLKSFAEPRMIGVDRFQRYRILRWAILQHYEICATPLLDVTHSLRIACSFASLHRQSQAYLYVLGVPNLSGSVTASAEAGLQIVRLSSVCPPSAIRPHIQEGYLLGEYPDMVGPEQKANYKHYEIDFGRRLVAKFIFNPKSFWTSNAFPKVGKLALYPSATHDTIHRIATSIKHKSKK